MSARRSQRRSARVRRITVDERLADDLIRVVACPLAKGVREFFDREKDWGVERQSLIRPNNYVRKLGIPSPEEWPWEALEEGQVFLSGEFESVPSEDKADQGAPAYFRVRRGRKKFQRIDDLEVFKKSVKQLYSDALAGRLRDDEAY